MAALGGVSLQLLLLLLLVPPAEKLSPCLRSVQVYVAAMSRVAVVVLRTVCYFTSVADGPCTTLAGV